KEPGWVSADFQAVTRRMLEQSAELKDRMAILDVYGTPLATKENYEDIINRFREDVGEAGLSYGAGYFPFLATTVIPIDDFDYTNITGVTGGTPLSEILTWQAANLYNGGYLPGADQGTKRYLAVKADIDAMATTTTEPGITKLNNNLMASLPLLKDMLRIMIAKESILPPSGAMAGIYTYNDATRGVWNAPANLTLSGVDRTTFKLNDEQQGEMNVPVNGKAVDALREFVGRGVVVWGARTLDGNSNDNRYIQVRRTLITVEQSIKLSLDKFVFAANDANTWVTVVSMISNYLQGFWSQGGLMGSTAQEAFSVQCGLGSTMTPMDVLEGYMIVQVTLQMIRPAEFIELTFKQKMEGLG
ncbi:MAG TPA: phage tail sheath subtilisin-like domain-containing protein, partial [Acidobacteriota bacterium]|nr:phage tail sheath subtilisin-like domain-containing protein [Acidobacteriota bacterium]